MADNLTTSPLRPSPESVNESHPLDCQECGARAELNRMADEFWVSCRRDGVLCCSTVLLESAEAAEKEWAGLHVQPGK